MAELDFTIKAGMIATESRQLLDKIVKAMARKDSKERDRLMSQLDRRMGELETRAIEALTGQPRYRQ